ncbi:uncharacterized protein LOC133518207 [Cydia pomonella]|uniref:uncharacterized protein LOC133518207 n=1 Tax=Cydia pomonella TaxID=82600 RepID=UPI002ADD7A04|nr:uncharacterized protein LOC133518207 [Cydia pomonella]
MTGCSVAASVCRWGARLRSLTLDGIESLDDEDVVAVIRGCPEIMSLELIGSKYLTPDLPALASAARHAARPGVRLRLQIDYSLMSDEVRMAQMCGEYDQFKSEYEDLDIEFYGYLKIILQ